MGQQGRARWQGAGVGGQGAWGGGWRGVHDEISGTCLWGRQSGRRAEHRGKLEDSLVLGHLCGHVPPAVRQLFPPPDLRQLQSAVPGSGFCHAKAAGVAKLTTEQSSTISPFSILGRVPMRSALSNLKLWGRGGIWQAPFSHSQSAQRQGKGIFGGVFLMNGVLD